MANELFNALFFLTISLVTFWLSPRRLKLYLLLAESFLFSYLTGLDWALILLILSLLTYSIGQLIKKINTLWGRQFMLFTGIIINIVPLVFFKTPWANHSILLPLGLSYVIFQNISYLVDLLTGAFIIQISISEFMTYIFFFPKLTAGPVERTEHFVKQLRELSMPTYSQLVEGSRWILLGCFKKMIIADRAAIVSNAYYGSSGIHDGGSALIAFACNVIMLYADFSGYSDIAIGMAHMMGLQLTKNFNLPFFSKSFGDFWTNWNISVTRWFLDYIYKPFYRFVFGYLRTQPRIHYKHEICYVSSILATILALSFWHGLGVKFLVLGFLQALIIIGEFFFLKALKISPAKLKPGIFTFGYIFILFSSCASLLICPDLHRYLSDILQVLQFSSYKFQLLSNSYINRNFLIALTFFALTLLLECLYLKTRLISIVITSPKLSVLRWGIYCTIAVAIIYYGMFINANQFIYRQF